MTNSKLLEAAQKSEVRRVYDKIFDALEGEDSPYVVCALQTYLIFCMLRVSPEDRQHIAHELERRAPEMLEVADRAAAIDDGHGGRLRLPLVDYSRRKCRLSFF